MKKLIEEFLTSLEIKGYKTDRDGEMFGVYFVQLKDHLITLEEKSFPNFEIEKDFSYHDKEIEDFRKDLLNFKVEKELEEFDIENLRKYEKVSINNGSGEKYERK